MEVWLPLISEYGFPVMVTLYLLNRIEKKLDTLNNSLQQVTYQLQQNIPSEHKHAKKEIDDKSWTAC